MSENEKEGPRLTPQEARQLLGIFLPEATGGNAAEEENDAFIHCYVQQQLIHPFGSDQNRSDSTRHAFLHSEILFGRGNQQMVTERKEIIERWLEAADGALEEQHRRVDAGEIPDVWTGAPWELGRVR